MEEKSSTQPSKKTKERKKKLKKEPPDETLPAGWKVFLSKSHPDRVYYFHGKSGTTSWTRPEAGDPCAASVTKATQSKTEVPNQKLKSKKIKIEDEEFQDKKPDVIKILAKVKKEPEVEKASRKKPVRELKEEPDCEIVVLLEVCLFAFSKILWLSLF